MIMTQSSMMQTMEMVESVYGLMLSSIICQRCLRAIDGENQSVVDGEQRSLFTALKDFN
jgi:hypothetical protein